MLYQRIGYLLWFKFLNQFDFYFPVCLHLKQREIKIKTALKSFKQQQQQQQQQNNKKQIQTTTYT